MSILDWIKTRYENSKFDTSLNPKGKILISEEAIAAEVEEFIFNNKYLGDQDDDLYYVIQEYIQYVSDDNNDPDALMAGDDNNYLYYYAQVIREVILLKYLIDTNRLPKIYDETIAIPDGAKQFHFLEEEFQNILAFNKNKIIQHFRYELTPKLKKLFNSLDLTQYAYVTSEFESMEDVECRIIDDLHGSYRYWDSMILEKSIKREKMLEDSGQTLDEAVDKLQLDEEFNPVIEKIISSYFKRSESDASKKKYFEDGEAAVSAYFENKDIRYFPHEIEIIWDAIISDEKYIRNFLADSAMNEELLDLDHKEEVEIKSYAIKTFNEDPISNEIDFAMKITLDNRAGEKEIKVLVEGYDDEEFEIVSFIIDGVASAHNQSSISERFSFYNYSEINAVKSWKLKVL